MSDNFLRYLLVLREIPKAPRRVDTATLARRLEEHGLGVTRRTLQRDLERLSATFPLVCDDATKPYGWSWVEPSSKAEKAGPGSERMRALAQVAREVSAPTVRRRRNPRDKKLSLVARFSDRATDAIRALNGPSLVTRTERGGVRVEARVRDCPELRSWLRSLGADVEVLEPPKLRAEFRALAARLAGVYGPR
jgi:predicted DNA-binding transcriptional regulator YafY